MKYMGSKARYAKHILPIVLAGRKADQWYVEPFVGGANMIDKVSGPRVGADINPYLVALLKAVGEGWTPPRAVTEADYRHARLNQATLPPHLVGYIGFQLSYGGKWFGGYRRDRVGKRDYADEAYRNTMAQADGLKGVDWRCSSYTDLVMPPRAIVYCDPPYAGTTKYRDAFDHVVFWRWCQGLVEAGHRVFVSEYAAPEPWRCVWSQEVCSSLTKETGSKRATERLFTL